MHVRNDGGLSDIAKNESVEPGGRELMINETREVVTVSVGK